MRRTLALLPIVVGLLLLPDASLAAESTPEEVVRDAETGFRSAMEAWGYEEHWRLWEMGTSLSRLALSREEFTDRMRRGNTRPAAGKQAEAIQVIPTQPDSVLAYVRFGLEDKRRPWAESVVRPFLLRLEEGRWRVSLWDFVGLANYFPPDFFPEQPLFVPTPRTPRPKGTMR